MAKKKTSKKKRGRPPGSGKKAPGRPAKKGTRGKKKRGPGRPPGSKSKKKRGPGRPPGSTTKKRRGRPLGRPAKAGRSDDLASMIDGRTKTVTLIRIQQRLEELLKERPATEVGRIKKAMTEAQSIRQKYEEAMALIGEEIIPI